MIRMTIKSRNPTSIQTLRYCILNITSGNKFETESKIED